MQNNDDCQVPWENFLLNQDHVKLRTLEFVFRKNNKIDWIIATSSNISSDHVKLWFQVLKKAYMSYPQHSDLLYNLTISLPINDPHLIIFVTDCISLGRNYSDKVFFEILQNYQDHLVYSLMPMISDPRFPLHLIDLLSNQLIHENKQRTLGIFLKHPNLRKDQINLIIDNHEAINYIPKVTLYPQYATYKWVFQDLRKKINIYNQDDYLKIVQICNNFSNFEIFFLGQKFPILKDFGLKASIIDASIDLLEESKNA